MTDNKPYPYYEMENINNLEELLNYVYKNNKDGIAFTYYDGKRYIDKKVSDFYKDVNQVKNYLLDNYKNKHIAIIGENSYSWIVLYFAIVLSNNVAVIIDKDLDNETKETLLINSDTKIVFASKDYFDETIFKKYKIYNLNNLNEYKTTKKLKNPIIDNDKCSQIFFTSGTTGPNKGVMLSNKNVASNLVNICALFEPAGSVVAVLPFHHAFGLITSILKPFFYLKPILINNSLKRVLKDIEYYKPNTLFVVPQFVETFYKQIWLGVKKQKKVRLVKTMTKVSSGLCKVNIDFRKLFFKSILNKFGGNLEYIICGGAYLDKKYVKWFRNIGINVLNGYGITEHSPVISVNRNHYYKDGSVGQIGKDIDVKIIDGEVVVKSDSVMLGYYKDKKSTNEVIKDGWFYTGDFGYLDKDNFLFLTGRKKNVIILSNGENISPEVIESELLHDDAVLEVIVYEEGNKMIAQIYPNEEYFGDQEYFDKLVDKYNKDKPKNHQITNVILRNNEFVKNSNKKILRDKIKEGL